MMSRNFAPKPAYDALKDYAPGAGGCSYERNPVPPAEPAPGPTPGDEPDRGRNDDETDSTVRTSPVLEVTRARIRRGRLAISGRVASGVSGRIRGRAHFGHGLRRFTVSIDRRGKFRIDKFLRGGRRASSARVTLSYRGTRRFLSQSLTVRVGRTNAQLRVLNAR